MSFSIFFDSVCEAFESPIFFFEYFSAALSDDFGELLSESIDLSGGYILSSDKDAFVESHSESPYG